MIKRLLALTAVIGALLYVGAVHTGALITYFKDLTDSEPEENDSSEEKND